MKKMMKSLMAGLMATGCLIAYGETQTADGPEMYTDMIRLKYADADDVTRMCNNVVNTNLVRFRPDRRCNTIIVTAPKTDLATIKRVIDEMDLRPSQVQLETVFIQVELDDDLQTGADWIERGRQKFFEDGKLNIAAIVQAAKSDSRTKILCTPSPHDAITKEEDKLLNSHNLRESMPDDKYDVLAGNPFSRYDAAGIVVHQW